MISISINKNQFADCDTIQHYEWLETNGLGGYSSSTVSGMNTRKYHGIFVPALQPPVGRTVLVNKLDETVSVDGNDSYVGLLGGSGNVNDTSSSGRLVLYGNSATGSVGNVVISSGTSGSVSICTNDQH